MILSLRFPILCLYGNIIFSRRYANQDGREIWVVLIAFLYFKAISHVYNPKYVAK